MIDAIIEFSGRNKFVVFILVGFAVAAGLCAAAVGTDTLGSVRVPAALTGVYGYKPTAGLISTDRVTPLSWTLDHVGVIARSAEDCGRMLAGASGAEAELASEDEKLEQASRELTKRPRRRDEEADDGGLEAQVGRVRR